MTLIVHIGYHKTGSTAIQSFLSKNRHELERAGLELPPGLSQWLGHPEIPWATSESTDPWQDRTYSLAEISNHYRPILESSRSPGKIVLLTSEEFCRYDIMESKMESLARFLLPYDPIIVGYTRNPLDFLLSRYRHEVQSGAEQRPLIKFLSNPPALHSANFGMRTGMWEKHFQGRCVWRSYDDVMKTSPSIVNHFLSLLGIDINHMKVEDEDGELKIHPALIPAMRLVAGSKLSFEERKECFHLLIATGDELPRAHLRDMLADLGATPDLLEKIEALASEEVNTSRAVAAFAQPAIN